METFEKETIEIMQVDTLEPKSILVKIYKIIIDECSEKQTKELYKTIEYFPKRIKRKPKYGENK